MRSTSACLALLLAFATTGCGQHGFPPPERINLSAPATVPMEFIAGRLVVSAKINGRGPYKFILDSGAQVSLLAAPFGQELGLPVSGEMPVGSPGSTTPRSGRILQVDRLEIGTLAAEKFSLLEMDLTSLQQRVPGLKGVISAHLFTGILITYDYPAAVMRYIVFKGSVAVDGISLTVAAVQKKSFRIWIIPHTFEVTVLRER